MGRKIIWAVVIFAGLVLLLTCVIVIKLKRSEYLTASDLRNPAGPAFIVFVEQYHRSRPPWEIPGIILGSRERGPWLDQDSAGAKAGNVNLHRLELTADDSWDVSIQTDADGRIAAGTRIGFPIKLGGRPVKFICRPANPAVGYFNLTNRADANEIDGSFIIEVTTCTNAVSGKTALWPDRPLRIQGVFARLPHVRG